MLARSVISDVMDQIAIASIERGFEMTSFDDVYRERNQLVAHLAASFDSYIGIDPNEPEWPVVYIQLPTGQVSWHIPRSEMNFFEGIKTEEEHCHPIPYDGHTTEEKYGRLNAHTNWLNQGSGGYDD